MQGQGSRTSLIKKTRKSRVDRAANREVEKLTEYSAKPLNIKFTKYEESKNKFANPEIEAKAAALRAEMEALLAEGYNRNSKYSFQRDSFYEDMEGFYAGDDDKPMKKHASPTTRLRQHKDSTVEHKDMIRKSLRTSADYSLTYCLNPDKAYVVEPEGGELNYDEAYVNKNKFV